MCCPASALRFKSSLNKAQHTLGRPFSRIDCVFWKCEDQHEIWKLIQGVLSAFERRDMQSMEDFLQCLRVHYI